MPSEFGYLTWRELRAKRNEVTDDRLLDEPVVFGHLNNYGDTTAYPVQLFTYEP
jgi:hypothetical protein